MAGGLQSAGSSHSCRARVFMTYMFLDQACVKSTVRMCTKNHRELKALQAWSFVTVLVDAQGGSCRTTERRVSPSFWRLLRRGPALLRFLQSVRQERRTECETTRKAEDLTSLITPRLRFTTSQTARILFRFASQTNAFNIFRFSANDAQRCEARRGPPLLTAAMV